MKWEQLDAVTAARRLLGCELVSTVGGQRTSGIIVETEAYDQTDAASHSYKGRTPRTDVMFGPGGHLYVYFTYGMHYCFNLVVGPPGMGAAVLIRALEPTAGKSVMERRRKQPGVLLTNGPAKACQALGIDKSLNGHDITAEPVKLLLREPIPVHDVAVATRIGITKDAHRPWRFYVRGNAYVSHS